MHDHQHTTGPEDGDLRPKAARLDERSDSLLFEAAAAGRPDVLGSDGMLRMQRAVGNNATAEMAESPVLDVVSGGGGSALDAPLRQDMESRLGADFSDVRVHTDDRAHASAQSVNAQAYTVGSNIVFQRDKYDPASSDGQTMLAHELTHVVQQRSGPVDGTPNGTGVSVSDPSDRFEREAVANADRVMSAPAAVPATAPGTGAGGAAVQREEGDEEELQTFVQREEGDEEELQTFVQREEAPEEEELG